MTSLTHNAVYNALIVFLRMRLRNSASRAVSCSACLLVVLGSAGSGAAATARFQAAEEQLAGKVIAVTGPGAITVDLTNRSSISPSDADQIRRELLTELAASGARFVNAEVAAASVHVTLSEDLNSYVWIAEIHQGTNEPSVVMVSTTRPESAMSTRPAPAITLQKTLLWSSPERILDTAVVSGNPQHLVVLYPDQVVLYRLQDSRWQPEQSLPVGHARPWPRDMRGRLLLRKDHLLDAYLPGIFCRSSGNTPLSLNCRDSDDPWPLGVEQPGLSAFFAPARNFFTGALSPGIGQQRAAPAFYSAAAVPREKYTLWIFAAVDGQVHLLDGLTDQQAGTLGWGSDIAGVHSSCGAGWQVLATSSGDRASDTVRAFEFPDREPVAASQAVEFPGGVSALWTDSDGSGAVAIAHNAESGKYEAYRLTVSCNQ